MSTPADILNAYAFQIMRAGDYPTAAVYLHKALDADPKNRDALNNLASTYKALGREPEAMLIYERLLVDEPDYLPPRNNLAFSHLRMGNYVQGWQMYRHRLKAHAKHASLNSHPRSPVSGRFMWEEPLPRADELRDRHVIVVPEQGIGDELFFLRFAAEAKARLRPASLWYAPSPKVYPLVARWNAAITATDTSFFSAPKSGALAVPLADLPLLCGHDGTWFPESLRFAIEPSEAHRGAVGVTWRAGVVEGVHKGTIFKGMSPAALGHALRAVERPIVVIQRNASEAELAAFSDALGRIPDVFPAEPLSPGLELTALAAMLGSLHAYVGVSSTNMHLMAAMGGTAHVLVPLPAEWRWPITHDFASPWFPGFKVYRQTIMEGWDLSLERVAEALK